ncbi:MAG: DUF4959 domain-containing protein [bacterium]|nr:DUF4959 domain-containing protein [bacterium]MDD3969100.1 DUF4959 domain-containing protein [Proteiniphilum sp.]MDD4435916.1 DUF4959 domain-containing protein [Bacteroidales bacterium]
MKAIHLLLAILVSLLFFACEEKQLEPINESKGKPAPVSDVVVMYAPGGAILSFKLPPDDDVLAVKAVYTLSNGKVRESITSFYGDNLKIEGYNDTNEHEALLYTVSRSQELSDPLLVKFTPQESPLSKAIRTMEISSDFGGAYYTWKNLDKVLLTAEMVVEADNGDMQTARIVTSNLETPFFSIRGYEPTPRKFGIILKDNWDNLSDTIYPEGGTVTPWLEMTLDKNLWSIYKINGSYLPGDGTFTNWEGRDEYMFDGDVNTFGHSYSGSLPVGITIDLGKPAMLSRVTFFQRFQNGVYYSWGNPRRIIVYGRKDAPTNGNWDEWIQLIDYTMVKPSGTNDQYTVNTDEDRLAALNGHEASFPISSDSYRYLRFRFMTSWENRPYVHPAEITVQGVYEGEE